MDLDKLYSPTKWSKRLSPDVLLESHLNFAKQKGDKARETIPCELNIPYGPLEKEKIDIFGTDLSNEAPVFAFIHGGYWQVPTLKRDTYHFLAPNLHKNGIKSIFIGYELCPQVSFDEIVQEIETAVKKCLDYVVQNNSRGLYLAGYSAGSHLLANFFTNHVKTHDLIKGVVLIAGLYDLTLIPKTWVNGPLKLDEEAALRLSPGKQKLTIEFLIVVAEDDSPEFKRQSKEFHEKLQNSTLMVVDNADHFTVIEAFVNENYEVAKKIIDIINKGA